MLKTGSGERTKGSLEVVAEAILKTLMIREVLEGIYLKPGRWRAVTYRSTDVGHEWGTLGSAYEYVGNCIRNRLMQTDCEGGLFRVELCQYRLVVLYGDEKVAVLQIEDRGQDTQDDSVKGVSGDVGQRRSLTEEMNFFMDRYMAIGASSESLARLKRAYKVKEQEHKAGLVSKETTEEEKGVGQCPLADAVIAHYDIESQLTRLTESGGQWVRLWPISIKGYDEGHCVEDVLSALRLSVANDPANSPYFSVRDFSTHFKNDEFCLCVHTGLVKTTVFKATRVYY